MAGIPEGTHTTFIPPEGEPVPTVQGVIAPLQTGVVTTWLGGAVEGNQFTITDMNADLLWYYANLQERYAIRSVGLVALDTQGNETDRIIPNSANGGIMSANFVVTPAGENQVGGCRNAVITTARALNMPPRGSIKLQFNNQYVFLGRVAKPPKVYKGRVANKTTYLDLYTYELEGWKVYANEIYIFDLVIENQTVSNAIQAIVSQLAGKTPITLDVNKIDIFNQRLQFQKFDAVTVADALNMLVEIEPSILWGINELGVFYAIDATKQTDIKDYFIGTNDVEITDMQTNADKIRNVIVASAANLDQNGQPIRVSVEDTASITAYGRVEELMKFPFEVKQNIKIEPLVNSYRTPKPAKRILEDVNGTLIPHYYVDDYTSQEPAGRGFVVDFKRPVTALTFKQERLPDAGTVNTIDIYNHETGELLEQLTLAGGGSSVSIGILKTVSVFRIIGRSPVRLRDGTEYTGFTRWILSEIYGYEGTKEDLRAYATNVLKYTKQPFSTATLRLPPNQFIPPPTKIRVSRTGSISEKYNVQSAAYTLEQGLSSSYSLTSGETRYDNLEVFQRRQELVLQQRTKIINESLGADIRGLKADFYTAGFEGALPANKAIFYFDMKKKSTLELFRAEAKKEPEFNVSIIVHKNSQQVAEIFFPAEQYYGEWRFLNGLTEITCEQGDFIVLNTQNSTYGMENTVISLRGRWIE